MSEQETQNDVLRDSLNTGFKRSILKTLTGVDNKYLPRVNNSEFNELFLSKIHFGDHSMINPEDFIGKITPRTLNQAEDTIIARSFRDFHEIVWNHDNRIHSIESITDFLVKYIDPDISKFLKDLGIDLTTPSSIHSLINADITREPEDLDWFNTDTYKQTNILFHTFIFEASKAIFINDKHRDKDKYIDDLEILYWIGIEGPLEADNWDVIRQERQKKFDAIREEYYWEHFGALPYEINRKAIENRPSYRPYEIPDEFIPGQGGTYDYLN